MCKVKVPIQRLLFQKADVRQRQGRFDRCELFLVPDIQLIDKARGAFIAVVRGGFDIVRACYCPFAVSVT